MKVLREGDVHSPTELTARVLLEGNFARSFTDDDNTAVVATDTMKNTVYVLANEHLGVEREPFAQRLAGHFLDRYRQVSRVTIRLDEREWTRLPVRGEAHAHSFAQSGVTCPFTRLVADASSACLESGVAGLTLLKTTGSGFERFHRDEWTTLADTADRMLLTTACAWWRWTGQPASYRAANQEIVEAMLTPFAREYSPSVQATLYRMATAALAACPQIERVKLVVPNFHCLPVDLTPFGRQNRQDLFVPTREPHGTIEATVIR